MVAVNHVIVSLEGMTIAPEDLHLLQVTSINVVGRYNHLYIYELKSY